ncbi:MAG TPA: peptidoglycan DD-metalloendopeptidase family protein [Acidimicrobiia bacterium]|nr:peptidoglycan DD-metalloendopeptidase family protein [Acidimicrobiia bacterium]
MHLHQPRREVTICLVLCLAASSFLVARRTGVAGAARAPGSCGAWLPPVDGDITRAFQAPAFAYGPGHRGVDFAAAPGTPVRASADGVVAFAGSVAGALHVVVAHDGGLRTTYAFLAGVAVREGDRVGRGQVVGATGGIGPEHPGGRLHFGVRLGDRYLDPQQLLEVCDLTQLVRLVPVDELPAEPWDARRWSAPGSLTSGGSGVTAVAGDLAGALGDAARVSADAGRRGWDAMTGFAGTAAGGARAAADAGVAAGRGLASVATAVFDRSPAGIAASVAVDVAGGAVDWWRHRRECSDASSSANGTGGSGHLLMAVGGIDSVGAPDDPTFGLDTRALGYHDDEVTYFSYAPGGGAYSPAQTHGDLRRAGLGLAEQLKRMQREHPGREVDLIAHSQGGVVVDVFLQNDYDARDPEYPPIGTVVTLSSPHEGAPLATAAADWRRSPVGDALIDAAQGRIPVASADAPSVRQLDEHSHFLRALWNDRLPDHVDFTTIGATDDVLVPATQIDVADATKVVVDVGGDPLGDHADIPHDPGALGVVRAALEGRPPPCVGVAEGVRGVLVPTVITRVEHGLADLPVVSR